MTKINDPYLTITNKFNKNNPDNFKDFEYVEVPVAMGDWGKKTALIETKTKAAFDDVVLDLQAIGGDATLDSAHRTNHDQRYARLEKFGGTLKRTHLIKSATQAVKNECARVGFSEHASGRALDITVDMSNAIIPEIIKEKYAPEVKELDENTTKYLKFIIKRRIFEKRGFILRYPIDDRLTKVTGAAKPEGWHWTYVGPNHSRMIAHIREIVESNTGEKHEVLLEDYVELLSHDLSYLGEDCNKEQLAEEYARIFQEEILGLKTEQNLSI